MIRCTVKGSFKKTRGFLSRFERTNFSNLLKSYAEDGVQALKSATPVVTGRTADSWSYEIVEEPGVVSIYWTNSNLKDGVPIAVILDYGHGTGTGGYVQGRHFISPAIAPIFDKIAEAAWKEVAKK